MPMSKSGTFTLRSWLAAVGLVVGWGRQSGGVGGASGRWVGFVVGWGRQSGGVALLNHRLQAGTPCGVRIW